MKASPQRHWRSYGTDTLPTPAEALDQRFSALPSWFPRIECDQCGKLMLNEALSAQGWRNRTLDDSLRRVSGERRNYCPGIERCWPVRRIPQVAAQVPA